MNREHYQCKRCKMERVIESMGTVVSPPLCKNCRIVMRKVVVQQLQLRLWEPGTEPYECQGTIRGFPDGSRAGQVPDSNSE